MRIARLRPRFGIVPAVVTIAALVFAGATAVSEPDDGLPAGYGVRLPSGSAVTTTIGSPEDATDIDDYTVEVEAGRTLTALLVPVGKPRPNLFAQLEDEAGTLLAQTPEFGKVRIVHTPEATGRFRLRVRAPGEEPGGAYSLRVTISGPTGARVRDAVPDGNGQYRFAVAARGGARIGARLRFRDAAPRFSALTAPDGAPVTLPAAAIRTSARDVVIRPVLLADDLPFGDFAVTFDAPATGLATHVEFTATVKGPRIPPRRGKLATLEPAVTSVTPAVGADGTVLRVAVAHAADPKPTSPFVLRIGRTVLADARFDPAGQTASVRATVPASAPNGTFDVVLETATGQVAVLPAAFSKVPPPRAESFLPLAATATGGTQVTIRGRDFRAGRMGVRIDGGLAPVIATSTATTVRFVVPPSSPGEVVLGVVDLDTQRTSDVNQATFLLAAWAEIGSLEPDLVPSLGGGAVTIRGDFFAPDDVLEVETTTPGTWEAVPSAWVSDTECGFSPPARPVGSYGVRIRNASGRISRPFPLRFFSYADVTGTFGLPETIPLDAVSVEVADLDRDGDGDLVLARDPGGAAGASSHTRILRNDGATGLVDATTAMMPPVSAADDWRAARVRVGDVDGDGWPDLVLGTNDTDVVAATRSHVRVLRNEQKSAAEPSARVFRDRTTDLFPAPFRYAPTWGSTRPSDLDSWAARDLWVGDLDSGVEGTLEIVATTDRTFAAPYVSCTPYCTSVYGSGYAYGIYWGGTRVFRWDPSARAGLGRFRRDRFAMPHRQGMTHWFWGAPPGIYFPLCNPSSSPCEGKFTPFSGQRLAVGDVDGDGRADIAVVSASAPTVSGAAVSALQVRLGRPPDAPTDWWAGTGADLTAALTGLSLDLRGDAVALGHIGAPGGSGVIAVGRSSAGAPGTGPGLRLLRHVPGADGAVGTFEDATDELLGVPPVGESWWSSALEFTDADGDGREDLVVLGTTAPSGALSALRVLRGTADGTFLDDVRPLIEAIAGSGISGSALAIGDLDGGGALEIVVSRATSAGAGSATRIVRVVR